jgi:hypothetical protein
MLTLFEQALIMHLIGDWILQNDWMARNKPNLRHPAAWVHTGIHVVLVGLVLGWVAGLVLGILHMLIDTRQVFRFCRKLFRMTADDPMGTHVAIWTDQVLHVLCIAAWVQFVVPHM